MITAIKLKKPTAYLRAFLTAVARLRAAAKREPSSVDEETETLIGNLIESLERLIELLREQKPTAKERKFSLETALLLVKALEQLLAAAFDSKSHD